MKRKRKEGKMEGVKEVRKKRKEGRDAKKPITNPKGLNLSKKD